MLESALEAIMPVAGLALADFDQQKVTQRVACVTRHTSYILRPVYSDATQLDVELS